MRFITARRLLCFALAASALPALAGNQVVSSANISQCSTSQNREWEHATVHQQGATASDPEGHRIHTYSLYESDWFNSDDKVYQPYSVVKRVLCGVVGKFGFYDPSFSDEADWNIFLLPTPAFASLLSDPIARGAGEIHDCLGGSNNCMEAEITPDEGLYHSPWFPRSGPSPLVGKTICVYGSWVGDFGHDGRPEIHPSEVLWWRETQGAVDWTTVHLVQEDSNRFDRLSRGEWYYRTGSSPVAGWQPWSRAPRRMDVRFPFAAQSGAPVYHFDIHSVHPRNVTTSWSPTAWFDADDGKHHALVYDGFLAVAAEEHQVNDDDLGVTFTGLCRHGSELRGFVQLAARIGVNDHGQEGFFVLRVGKRERQSHSTLPDAPPVVAYDEVVTLPPEDGLVVFPGPRATGPLADLPFELQGGDGATLEDLSLVSAELVFAEGLRSPVELRITERPSEGNPTRGVLLALPTLPAWTLELTAASGKVHRQTSDGHAVAARVEDRSRHSLAAGVTLWETFAEAAGGRGGVVPGVVAGATELNLLLAAGYVPKRGSDAQAEEGSSAMRALNLVLAESDAARRLDLFGNLHPLNANWTLTARNLSTGELVRMVESQNPGPGTLGYQILVANPPESDGVRIVVPAASAGELFEVEATARVTDPFGNVGEAKATVWSHALLPADGIESLLGAVAEMRGLDAADLLSASKLEIDPAEAGAELDRHAETARGVRMVAEAALEDGVVTVTELTELLAAADLYGSRTRS